MNKRKAKRIQLKDYLKIQNFEDNEIVGNIVNISESGLMLESNCMNSDYDKIKCKLLLPQPIKSQKELIFSIEKRWSRKVVNQHIWESGYQIECDEHCSFLLALLILHLKLKNITIQNSQELEVIELENRRQSTRYIPSCILPVYEMNRNNIVGEIIDISQTGIKLIVNNKVTNGSIVKYRVKLPKKILQRDYLKFEAKIVWIKQIEHIEKSVCGLYFTNISELDSNIILYLMLHYSEIQETKKRLKVK